MAFAVNVEQWRMVDGYNNYEVSSHGRIRNNNTNKILKSCLSGGYQRVNCCKDGKVKQYLVHRLVAFAFCDNPNNYDMVDHFDRNRLNNMFNNLRWVTSSENNRNLSISKRNKSGIKGVYKDGNSWQAYFQNNESKRQSKNFSIAKYGGDEEAKTLAIEWRKARELEFGYL